MCPPHKTANIRVASRAADLHSRHRRAKIIRDFRSFAMKRAMATSGTSERDGSGALHQLCEADESLHAGFERVAAIHPLHTALISDRWQPTYAELNATANRLAHAIMARGGATGDRVAILMDHDAPAIAAVIAVMKAGRIVVALNPTHPPERLRELIADSEPTVIISDTNLSDLAKSISGPNCTFVRFEDQSDHWPEHNPAIELPPDNVATLAYTSGSTGHPKAVMMTHRSIRRNVMIRTEALQYCAEDRIPLLTSLLGGQGMTTAWCALLNGAALCPFPVIVKGVTGLADWMTRHKATVFPSSASIFRNFMKTLDRDCKLSGVRAVRISSEPATSDDFKLFQQHFPDDCWFVHTLSSSETSNIAWSRRTHHDQVPEGKLPIGAVSQGQEVCFSTRITIRSRPARWARSSCAAATSPPAIGAIPN
jgi:non-ribosomal peptide synthetase component F